jgi:hypothetical protein
MLTHPDPHAPRWNPLSGVGELLSFLGAGVAAIIQFWAPKRAADLEADLPDDAEDPQPAERLSDHFETAVKRLAPYPGQEG